MQLILLVEWGNELQTVFYVSKPFWQPFTKGTIFIRNKREKNCAFCKPKCTQELIMNQGTKNTSIQEKNKKYNISET